MRDYPYYMARTNQPASSPTRLEERGDWYLSWETPHDARYTSALQAIETFFSAERDLLARHNLVTLRSVRGRCVWRRVASDGRCGPHRHITIEVRRDG